MVLSRLKYFRRSPNYLHVDTVRNLTVMTDSPTGYHLARPLGYYGLWHRLRLAWLVFSGKADALLWGAGQ